ncbi:allantoicase [Pseudazoarcus pumilus]|uniref:Probable allantoicase n=1 Tax=Pseudazoarcus pumilus TaxID=2067960 RepID=A0A2I6S3A9_9RHOO|nr:allantoicase [Pseudazoarcus pumilus]AUN93749.1 allantoicase [Pseudazoarcus pumilus]
MTAPDRIRIAEPADLPDWAKSASNLADPRLGASPVSASDEFFAPVTRMLDPAPAEFHPGRYDDHGKWMDGWETRRRRGPGHDHCIVRLAGRGTIRGFDIDTSHFTGNYAPAVSIEATCTEREEPGDDATWTEVLPLTALAGNRHHLLECLAGGEWTHLRVHIFPDGGIARLRVYGVFCSAIREAAADALVDLAALTNGARPVAWNDSHFGSVENLLLPGRGVDMGDGWETRRRREPGHDWCIVALAAPGEIERIEIDTAHFKGNFPDRCSVQAACIADGGTPASLVAQSMFWPVLLPESPLSADAEHAFASTVARIGPVTHVRLNIIPDGGVSRLRVWGRVAR